MHRRGLGLLAGILRGLSCRLLGLHFTGAAGPALLGRIFSAYPIYVRISLGSSTLLGGALLRRGFGLGRGLGLGRRLLCRRASARGRRAFRSTKGACRGDVCRSHGRGCLGRPSAPLGRCRLGRVRCRGRAGSRGRVNRRLSFRLRHPPAQSASGQTPRSRQRGNIIHAKVGGAPPVAAGLLLRRERIALPLL